MRGSSPRMTTRRRSALAAMAAREPMAYARPRHTNAGGRKAMRKLVEYPTPSLAERDRRWAAVRKEMDARGLDCLILCGWPAMWDFNIANARYLCPIGGNAEFNVLVFPRTGEPTSFIYSPVFTDYWRGAQNWVSDVRPKRGTFGDSVADRLADLGLAGAKVGIDGLAGPLDPDGWVPHSMYARLQERLPKVTLLNLDAMMETRRPVKSAEEVAILEKPAALGDLMLQACRDTARPGVKECEVYGRMMETMLANGGEEPTCGRPTRIPIRTRSACPPRARWRRAT